MTVYLDFSLVSLDNGVYRILNHILKIRRFFIDFKLAIFDFRNIQKIRNQAVQFFNLAQNLAHIRLFRTFRLEVELTVHQLNISLDTGQWRLQLMAGDAQKFIFLLFHLFLRIDIGESSHPVFNFIIVKNRRHPQEMVLVIAGSHFTNPDLQFQRRLFFLRTFKLFADIFVIHVRLRKYCTVCGIIEPAGVDKGYMTIMIQRKGNLRQGLQHQVKMVDFGLHHHLGLAPAFDFHLQTLMVLLQCKIIFLKVVKCFHLQQQDFRIYRLGNVINTAGFVAFGYKLFLCIDRRKKNNRNIFGLAVARKILCHLKAVHSRHLNIQNDERILVLKCFFQCFLTGFGGINLKILRL